MAQDENELQKKNGIMFSSFRPCFLEKTPETAYCLSKIFYSVSDTGNSEKKFRVLPAGVEPMTFWLLVQRWHIRNDINLMVNFKPGEYMRKMFYSVTQAARIMVCSSFEKIIRFIS